MRIVGGRFRGTALASVGGGDAKAHLRPTTDRVREALFNLLAHGSYGALFEDAHVLDLFAGTGALGLEALSRGALSVVFVDDGRKAGALISENIQKLHVQPQARLLRKDATRLGARPAHQPPVRLVFLDPPYGKNLADRCLAALLAGQWLSEDALIVLEENASLPAPEGYRLLDHRCYGETHIHLLSTL